MARYESVIDLIGNTPLVDISQLSPNPRAQILGKLDAEVKPDDTVTLMPAVAGGCGGS